MKTVAIIIVNWNGKADTLACLASLRADDYPCKHIIVVDNGSHDNSVSVIRANYPEVEVLSTGENLGFTGGNNAGIARAVESGAGYIFLLNNDTTLEADALTELVRAAEAHPDAGLCTPLIRYYDRPEEVWFGGSRITLANAWATHDNRALPEQNAGVQDIPWASGCAMLIPTEMMRQLGGFDDRFFLNWEDVDLSLRIGKAGRKIILVPAAVIYHKVGRAISTAGGAGLYYHVRNRLLLLRIYSKQRYSLNYGRVLLSVSRTALRAFIHHENNGLSGLRLVWRAICDDLLGRFGKASNL